MISTNGVDYLRTSLRHQNNNDDTDIYISTLWYVLRYGMIDKVRKISIDDKLTRQTRNCLITAIQRRCLVFFSFTDFVSWCCLNHYPHNFPFQMNNTILVSAIYPEQLLLHTYFIHTVKAFSKAETSQCIMIYKLNYKCILMIQSTPWNYVHRSCCA